ncbi:hypothetical protein IEO21_10400 [Rhodonia placenta]|uniref:Uncharacterized protein n=1 Tax=Rhodonia placenta TaxID=104341 RepID=A0A8H7NSN2_9APHY|nr:hypothetical protein IEO21_10400 [Postia placenta]
MVRGADKALKCGGGNAVKRNNEVNRTGGQGAPGCCLIYMRENPPGTGNGPLVPSWVRITKYHVPYGAIWRYR